MANATRALALPDGSEYEFFGRSYYGVYSNSGVTTTYAVDIPGFTQASLVAGVRVSIFFAYGSKQTNGKNLNVSSTGAKGIRLADSTFSAQQTAFNLPPDLWTTGQVVDFVYDGTYWLVLPPAPRIWYGSCSTEASTAAKTTAINGLSDDAQTDGLVIAVYFENGNTAISPTLSVNSCAARMIANNATGSAAVSAGKFAAGMRLLMLRIDSYFDSRWVDITYNPISDSTGYTSSVTYASSTAVKTAYDKANSKYTKPSSGIPATDLAPGVIPSAVSELTNDAGYLTLADLPIYDGSVT